jgi:hypothetical protein
VGSGARGGAVAGGAEEGCNSSRGCSDEGRDGDDDGSEKRWTLQRGPGGCCAGVVWCGVWAVEGCEGTGSNSPRALRVGGGESMKQRSLDAGEGEE